MLKKFVRVNLSFVQLSVSGGTSHSFLSTGLGKYEMNVQDIKPSRGILRISVGSRSCVMGMTQNLNGVVSTSKGAVAKAGV